MTRTEIEQILRRVFEAQGAVDAAGLAKRAAQDFEFAERNEQIYKLRATMTEEEISHRFGVTRRRVQQIIREQLDLHRDCA